VASLPLATPAHRARRAAVARVKAARRVAALPPATPAHRARRATALPPATLAHRRPWAVAVALWGQAAQRAAALPLATPAHRARRAAVARVKAARRVALRAAGRWAPMPRGALRSAQIVAG
jgi:hypothetical protein